mmetsp:Transcript_33679/g.46980  ORF Transcript_33679/g.46980 Transcript_33679/m.46980 type:complete len:135 (+) Transcript_33679:60-464(+)
MSTSHTCHTSHRTTSTSCGVVLGAQSRCLLPAANMFITNTGANLTPAIEPFGITEAIFTRSSTGTTRCSPALLVIGAAIQPSVAVAKIFARAKKKQRAQIVTSTILFSAADLTDFRATSVGNEWEQAAPHQILD